MKLWLWKKKNIGSLEKLRKATISFVMSVCLSFVRMAPYWMDVLKVTFLCIIQKILRKKIMFL
jgi:hypothetical protein